MTGLLQADAVALPLADDSVDLVVTSPPYFALRSYRDDGEHCDGQIGSEATPAEFLDALWAVTAECVRVLKPSGSLWVNLGDKYATQNPHQDGHRRDNPVAYKSLMGLPWRYALGCIDDLGLILRAEVVWSKPNGLPESVADRVRRSHEQWFHLTTGPRYFSAIDEIREEYLSDSSGFNGQQKDYGEYERRDGARVGVGEQNPLGKLPGSVWSIPSEPLKVPDDLGVQHFAAFPQEWPRRLILGWCPAEVCTACGQGRAPVTDKEATLPAPPVNTYNRRPTTVIGGGPPSGKGVVATITGYACACPDTTAPSTPGVVLDPFAGTGTVPMVAKALGRTGIGIDLSADYLRLATWRVFESGHASKTVARTNTERQGSLL